MVDMLLLEKRKNQQQNGINDYVITNEVIEKVFVSQITDGGSLIQTLFDRKRNGNYVISDIKGIMKGFLEENKCIPKELIELKRNSWNRDRTIINELSDLVDELAHHGYGDNLKEIFSSEYISQGIKNELKENLVKLFFSEFNNMNLVNSLINLNEIIKVDLKKILKQFLAVKNGDELEKSIKCVETLVSATSRRNAIIDGTYISDLFKNYSSINRLDPIKVLSFVRIDGKYLIKNRTIIKSLEIAERKGNKRIVDYLIRIKRPISASKAETIIKFNELEELVNKAVANNHPGIVKIIKEYISDHLETKQKMAEVKDKHYATEEQSSQTQGQDDVIKKNNREWKWEDVFNKIEKISLDEIMEIDLTLPIKKGNFNLLHVASMSDRSDIIKLLIDNGVPIDARCKESGDTALHMAVRKNKIDIIKFLVKNHADINVKNNYGYTPLHIASCDSNRIEALKELIINNANLNIQDREGNTPSHLAARYGLTDSLVCMILSGMNVNIKNKSNFTPLNILQEKGLGYTLQCIKGIIGKRFKKNTNVHKNEYNEHSDTELSEDEALPNSSGEHAQSSADESAHAEDEALSNPSRKRTRRPTENDTLDNKRPDLKNSPEKVKQAVASINGTPGIEMTSSTINAPSNSVNVISRPRPSGSDTAI